MVAGRDFRDLSPRQQQLCKGDFVAEMGRHYQEEMSCD